MLEIIMVKVRGHAVLMPMRRKAVVGLYAASCTCGDRGEVSVCTARLPAAAAGLSCKIDAAVQRIRDAAAIW